MKKFLLLALMAISLTACNLASTIEEERKNTPKYIDGFTVYDIHLNNCYYRFEVIGIGSDIQAYTIIETDYTAMKLNKDNLPYTYICDPAYISFFSSYDRFIIRAYAAANVSADGALVLERSVPASSLKGIDELIVKEEDNKTKIGILLRRGE